MKNESTLPQQKLRLLGNVLIVVASLGILLGLVIVPVTALTISIDPIPDTEELIKEDPEFAELMKENPNFEEDLNEAREVAYETFLPEGLSMDTTVRELIEYDRTFFEENRGQFQAFSYLSAAFTLIFAVLCLLLALSWRKAEPFGRPTIAGLRYLGILLVIQFSVGWIGAFAPEAWHADVFHWSDLYQSSVDWLLYGGPTLSSGILFLILSRVLDYGRQIKEEQALTI